MISVGFDSVVVEVPDNIKCQLKHRKTFFSVVLHHDLQTFILMRIKEFEGSCLVIRQGDGTWRNAPFCEENYKLLPEGVQIVNYL